MEVTAASPQLSSSSHPWDEVLGFTKRAQESPMDPQTWAIQISSFLGSAGVELPSPELAQLLVSHVCWANNVPTAWKYLEQAIASRLAPAMLVIAHLSTRVITTRSSKPSAYRMYMEILKKYLLSFAPEISGWSYKRCMASVGSVLQLSSKFGFQATEPGILVVEFVFCIMWQLLDASLDDENLLHLIPEKRPRWEITSQDMELDGAKSFDEKRLEYSDKFSQANTVMAIELMTQFLQHKVISRILNLARQNMQSDWENFSVRLHVFAANSIALRSLKVSHEIIHQFSLENQTLLEQHRYSPFRKTCPFATLTSPGGHFHGGNHSSLWIPLDLYLEYAIDGSIGATNAIEVISGLVKALKALNRTTWHDTFLGLWMAALRLVQRERDPIEGPSPHVDTRLCMLLSIMTLTVADIIEDEVNTTDDTQGSRVSHIREEGAPRERHNALVSSLEMLGNYEALLVPPSSVITAANQAAAKAMIFIAGIPVASGYRESLALNDKTLNCSGNMRHLIVEACVARNLLDTSAYYWPGYVSGHISQIPHSLPTQVPGWPSLMKGAPLTSSMAEILAKTPASSLMELEKIFEIAIKGSNDEKIFAATVICGDSLIRGWNIQEHTVRHAVELLSPPVPSGYSGNDSHLIGHAPILYVVLTGISSIDCVQIISFHGLIPELAAALMPICEAFGSSTPCRSWTLPSGEEISVHTVFSNAFILLLRLWRFNHPPIEYCMLGDAAPVGSQLTPEYLLFLRNSVVSSSGNPAKCRRQNKMPCSGLTPRHPIFIDSFPKLKLWYTNHQACLVSTLSGNVPGTQVHQNVDSLLNMMFRKVNKGSSISVGSVTSGSSSLSSSSGPGIEDNPFRPKLPAWDIMDAVPFVVDASLTACSHGILSPRELATGLKDLADFLPASLATIVSYFCAEVTRGVWKPAYMNGTDWPSPAANLSTVEEHIKKIVAATGADVPSLVTGNSPATLPLPLAAFVSLTITYRLDKASERSLNLAGPALERLAASCPWPSMPIVSALWAQKVKRWSDFLTFSASSTVFHHNNDAVVKLLQSCFSAALGLLTNSISENGGVGSFLGHGFGLHYSGGLSPVAPGILFLQIHRDVRDIILLTDQILSVLMFSVRKLASDGLPEEMREKLKKSKYGLKYGHISLLSGLSQLKVAASLASTLIWLSGGSSLINCLFREILPTLFLSSRASNQEGKEYVTSMLEGYTLAHLAVICGMFAWGVEPTPISKRRSKVIGAHLEFLAGALDGKITLGCSWGMWHAYIAGFLSLIVECAPCWIMEVELSLLKRLSNGLRLCNETDLAILLLGRGGALAMGAAAELIVSSQ